MTESDRCTCDWYELRARLSVRVYRPECLEHGPDSPADYEKHPFDSDMDLAEWQEMTCT